MASAKTDSTSSGHVQGIEARDHFADAILADGLELGDFLQQLSILRVHEIAENMDFDVIVFGGEFRAGDEFDARRLAGRRHARAALDRVMIRQRQRRKAEPLARARPVPPAKTCRRKNACADVGRQISFHDSGRPHQFALILSRMPLTNLPLSWVENFLAMSTASLMLTTGGMSSRWSIS